METHWRGVIHTGGHCYRYGRRGRRWVADRDCDCILGPHWHPVEVATATLYQLEQYLSRATWVR